MSSRPRRRDRKLTTRQRRFVEQYMQDGNATQAAIRAGYSKKAARTLGYKLRHTPHIERAIARRIEREMKGDEQARSRIVHELNCIAYIDPRDVVSWGADSVTLSPSTEIPDEVAAAIKSVKMTRDGLHITFHDKIAALRELKEIHRANRNLLEDAGKDVLQGGDVYFTIEIGDKILQPSGAKPKEIRLKQAIDLEKIAKGPDLLLEPGEADDDDEAEW